MYSNATYRGVLAAAIVIAGKASAAVHVDTLEPIVVTSTPVVESRLSSAQTIGILAGDELVLQIAPTIGETVARQPGVTSTFFGPAASRPVIRGLGGDRVLVLTDGMASLDAAGISEDHAVAIDPAFADRVEIVRGPATLLYGSSAAGGVVNVVTRKFHETSPEGPEGLIGLRGDSALGERGLAGRLDLPAGPVALHADAAWRDTNDYGIPGFVQSDALRKALVDAGATPDDTRGKVPESWSRSLAGNVAATWIHEAGWLGLAYGRHETKYGIPNESGLFIDLEQDRIDVAVRHELPADAVLRGHAAANDYRHAEIEPGGEIGTLYEVDGRDLRIALDHVLPGGFGGTAGLQWQQVDLRATGAEAFVPDSSTRSIGAFLFEQRDAGKVSIELGARIDRQEVSAPGVAGYRGTAINVSAGAIWAIRDRLDFVAQVARTERHPSPTELYANGPHAATRQFEIGDAGFGTERGLTADLGLRGSLGAVAAELRVFRSTYDRYLFLAATGEVEDGLPVFRYRQGAATFYGFEASVLLPLAATGLSVELLADAVDGRLHSGARLPRMPPMRLGAGLVFERGTLRASLAARHSFSRDEIAAGELPTDAHTMLDAELAWRLPWPGASETLMFLRTTNLLDQDARLHSSPLKEEAPLPGRSVSAGLRLEFGG